LVTNVGQSGMGFSGSLGARLGALAMAGVSPAFVTFLLLKVCFQDVLTSCFSSANSLTRFRVFLLARPSTTSVTVTARTTSSGRRYVLYVLIIRHARR
jgi:hypothetical protein